MRDTTYPGTTASKRAPRPSSCRPIREAFPATAVPITLPPGLDQRLCLFRGGKASARRFLSIAITSYWRCLLSRPYVDTDDFPCSTGRRSEERRVGKE